MLIVSKVRVDADRDIVLMHNNSQFMCNDCLFTVCSLACVNGLWNFLHRFLPKIPTLTGKLHNKSVRCMNIRTTNVVIFDGFLLIKLH